MNYIIKKLMCKLNLHSWYSLVSYLGDEVLSVHYKCSKCGEQKMESMLYRQNNKCLKK